MLEVSFQGNMRVIGQKCNRWYFKFNGNECSGPMTIEAAVWTGHQGTLICCIIGHLKDTVKTFHKAQLEWNYGWEGNSGHALGDAYTGWESVSRIMIEEVSRPQS